MSKNVLKNIFEPSGHISQADMDAYLQGGAPPDLVRKVEHAMLDDDIYSDAVDGYEEMGLTALPALEDFSEFKKKLPETVRGTVPHQHAKVVPMQTSRRWRRVALAAAAMFVAVAGYFALQNTEASNASLFTDFYEVYENDISLTRRGDTSFQLEPNLKAALGAYAKKEYAASLASFEKSIAAQPDNDAAHFFAGMACLESGNAAEAIDHFNMAGTGVGTYARKAQWYAILTALKLDDKELASDLLDAFLEEKGYKYEEAMKLKSQL